MPDINAVRQSANLYTYCLNDPVSYIDPSGEAIPFLAVAGMLLKAVVIGAAVNVLADVAIQGVFNGVRSWNDLDKTSLAISGTVGAISAGFGVTSIGWKGLAGINAGISAGGSVAQDYFHNRPINTGNAMIAGTLGAIGGAVAGDGVLYRTTFNMKTIDLSTRSILTTPYVKASTLQTTSRSISASAPASFLQTTGFSALESAATNWYNRTFSPISFNTGYQNSYYYATIFNTGYNNFFSPTFNSGYKNSNFYTGYGSSFYYPSFSLNTSWSYSSSNWSFSMYPTYEL